MQAKEEEKEYTRSQIAKRVDVKGQTIHFWTIIGLIVPNISSPSGAGFQRKYDRHNVIECFFIRYFQLEGFSLEKIKRILGLLRTWHKNKPVDMPNFFDDPSFDLYYRFIRYEGDKGPSTLEDIIPPTEKRGLFSGLEDMLKNAYYCEILDLGSIKRNILKNSNI